MRMGIAGAAGASKEHIITISAVTETFSLTTALVGVDQPTNVIIINNSTVGSLSLSTAAMTIENQHVDTTVTIINNGNILGSAGTGASGARVYCNVTGCGYGFNAGDGGPAIEILHPSVTIDNQGIIGGGGGGGGAGGASSDDTGTYGDQGWGGGGGGAGAGYNIRAGGGGGTVYLCAVNPQSGAAGASNSQTNGGNGGSGGGGTAVGVGGSAGNNGTTPAASSRAGGGGGGGGLGGAGGNGALPTIAAGYTCKSTATAPGKAAGKAVDTNGNTVVWTTIGARYGVVG